MNLKKSAIGILVLIISLFWATNPSEPQSTTCTVDIISTSVSGNLVVGNLVTFKVNATSNCVGSIYYKFFYRANYGTANYETSPWVSMTTADYVTDNELTYSFPSAGKYIVIAWAFADPATLDANTVSLIGFSVDITQAEGSTCPVDITGMSVTGVMAPGLPVTIKVTAAKRCTGQVYYKYFYRAKYGTADYNASPWVSMTTADYVTTNQIEYPFSEAGNYIVVVWAFSDPNSLDTSSVPIIGGSVSISNSMPPNILLDLGNYDVTMPETGNILMQIDEEAVIGSAIYYGIQTSSGPDLPLTKISGKTSDGWFDVLLDNQGRPMEITEGTTRTTITHNTNGTFNFEVAVNGTVVYTGNNLTIPQETARTDFPGFRKKIEMSPAAQSYREEPPPLTQAEIGKQSGYYLVITTQSVVGSFDQQGGVWQVKPEDAPFIELMRANPEIKRMAIRAYVLRVMLNRIMKEDFKDFCEELEPANRRQKCRQNIDYNRSAVIWAWKTMQAVLEEAIEDEYARFGIPEFPATYSGTAQIWVNGCATCSGTDRFTITLKADGTLTARQTFNVVIDTYTESCTVETSGVRIKEGFHDKNGHYSIPDHGIINQHYGRRTLIGHGTKQVAGSCMVHFDFTLWLQQTTRLHGKCRAISGPSVSYAQKFMKGKLRAISTGEEGNP